jgi:hypothetical protein
VAGFKPLTRGKLMSEADTSLIVRFFVDTNIWLYAFIEGGDSAIGRREIPQRSSNCYRCKYTSNQ